MVVTHNNGSSNHKALPISPIQMINAKSGLDWTSDQWLRIDKGFPRKKPVSSKSYSAVGDILTLET